MNEFYMQKYKLSMQNNCTPKENPPFIGKFACFKTEYYLFLHLSSINRLKCSGILDFMYAIR